MKYFQLVKISHRLLLGLFFIFQYDVYGQYGIPCDNTTPSFIVDLTGRPGGVYISPQTVRRGLCCGLDPAERPPIRCVEFWITLDTNAQGIRFDIASGAVPPGSLGYQINCGPYHMVGENICLNGAGPHRLTFCKPGNNPNTYAITSIPKPNVSPPITVSDGCSATLSAQGFQLSTIRWTSVLYNATHNSYLSCTQACSVVTATYQVGAPPYVDYQVSGIPAGGCNSELVTKTTRVYFVNDKRVDILPLEPTICYGGSNITLTAHATGGAPPYRYLWSNGSRNQSITVGEGTYSVTVTDSTSCPGASASTTVTAFHSPITANAGPDLTSCANNPDVHLNGSVTAATGGQWSGGGGTFSPSDVTLNVTYTPSAAEIAAGRATLILTTTGNGSCPPARDTVVINILPSPIVNAGPDITVCANNNTVLLNGSVLNAGGGTWTGGAGTFSPSRDALNATYIPTSNEALAGSVALTLTSTNNGPCLPVSDEIIVNITPAPVVDAGPDQTICANRPQLVLNGTVTVATGGRWTGGTGTFSPNANVLNATYTPSLSEINAGTVTLRLTSTGNGQCNPVFDIMQVTITPAPVVNAGPDLTVCANNPSIQITGSVTIATGGQWSGGKGTFAPSASALTITYTPSAEEIAVGKATLILTSTGNGNCNPVSDEMVITITPAPVVNAGPDISICANNAVASLSGNVTIATGGQWVGGNGTFSPGRNNLSTQYTPTATEIINRSVTLTLISTGNGNCLPVSDEILINITDAPVVDAGPDQNICGNTSSASLSGTVTVATGGTWTSSGAGTFSPSANNLSTAYNPTTADVSNGHVILTLTSTGNGNCRPVSDQARINLSPMPIVNAGPNRSICADANSVNITGTVTNAGGGTWTTSGSGSFSPTPDNLNVNYIPSLTDKGNGSVTLILTSTGNGVCPAQTSSMVLTITPAPTVVVPDDISICRDVNNVHLTSVITVATGVSWTSSGSGTFVPSNFVLNPTYVPSTADKTSGSVTLTATTTGNGTCNPVSDQVIITFTPTPTVNAGPDITVCSDNPGVSINASVNIATGVSWTGGAGTFSPDRNALNISYTPTASEMTAGAVTLRAITTGNGTCLPVTDEMVITINRAPTVNAGPDQTLCGSVTSAELNGIVQNANSVSWTHNGSGSFTPSGNVASTRYNISSDDLDQGSVSFTLTVTGAPGCNPVSDNIVISFAESPEIDAGPDINVCEFNVPVYLNAAGTPGRWTGGNGSFSPDNERLNTAYLPTEDEINTGVTLTITTNPTEFCPEVSDQVNITFTKAPIVSAGSDLTVCADTAGVRIQGSLTGSSTSVWSANGTGTISPNNNSLVITYVPSAADINSGKVTLYLTSTGVSICEPVSAQMELTITPAPTVNAGFDRIICADSREVNLSGNVTIAEGAIWTTISGTGNFTPDNNLTTTYHVTDQDTTNKSVVLRLTTTGNGNCKPVRDDVMITITPVPYASAGSDISVCRDVQSIPLSGNIGHSGGGVWSSAGSGIFIPGVHSLNTTYYPSATDKDQGNVLLSLTTSSNGNCNAVTNNILLTFTPVPVVTPGSDITVCADSAFVQLSGNVTIATGGSWTTSGTGTFSASNQLQTNYNISNQDRNNGTVTLSLTSTGNGTCNPITQSLRLFITPVPTINAGNDQTICADNREVSLFGSVTVATGGEWHTSGSGQFHPDHFRLNTIYIPSDADTAARLVKLAIVSTGNGSCKPVSDTMNLIITPVPVVNPGTLADICADSSYIRLSGSVAIATGGIWSTSGTGNFSPSSTVLNASYIPSETDKSSGSVLLTLTSTGNGNCKPVTASTPLTILPRPIADAGTDQTICADAGSVNLGGGVIRATGGMWTTTGSGSFDPSASELFTRYIISDQDTAAGRVKMYLTTTGTGLCKPVRDSVEIFITPAPSIEAGTDRLICAADAGVNLSGSVTVATSGYWITSGSGTFSPSEQGLNVQYVPSITDKAEGNVYLFFHSTGHGTCRAIKDSLQISFSPIPQVTGSSASICADNAGAELISTFSNAAGVVWSTSGSGSFSPDPTTANPTYLPSITDFANVNVTVSVSTTGNGACPPAVRNIPILIRPRPSADAGPDQQVCEDTEMVQLEGTVQNAGGGIWSQNGAGSFSPSASGLTTSYVVSQHDRENGSIKLYFTTTGNNGCEPKTDSLIVTLVPSPEVEVGEDQRICPGQSSINLTSIFANAGGVQWSTSGNGNFTAQNAAQTQYNLTTADSLAGMIKIYVVTTQNGLCQPVYDSLEVRYFPLPTVSAGGDQSVCRDAPAVAFFGDITVASSAIWSTTGTGTFSNPSSLLTYYEPSIEDKDNGKVTLILTSVLGNTCKQVIDSTDLFITPVPVPTAGPDITVCRDTDVILLNGSVTNASGGNWMTLGSGQFLPDENTLTATYVISDQDKNRGEAVLVLSTTGNNGCSNLDSVIVTIFPVPDLRLENIPACIGDIVYLNARPTNISGNANPVYTWYKNNQVIDFTGSEYSTTTDGFYKVEYTLGSCIRRDSSLVSFHPYPKPNADIKITFCKETQNTVKISAGPGHHYLWTGSGNTGMIEEVGEPGLYSVKVFNEHNCGVMDTVLVVDVCPPRVSVPNIFTPNKDGHNDGFITFSKYLKTYKLLIFNRWGEVIFHSEDPKEGWDGTYRGEDMPNGTYPWILYYEGNTEQNAGPFQMEGSVTLDR
ncbi:MAG: gliding motility-associated C-terminal domain-containing protein [Cytophagaceae bacterium]